MEGNFRRSKESLGVTILLGIYFTAIQVLEYVESPFSISDSSYGRTFFVATGFHGLHVLIGTLFLFFTFIRLNLVEININHHFEFEAAARYRYLIDEIFEALEKLLGK